MTRELVVKAREAANFYRSERPTANKTMEDLGPLEAKGIADRFDELAAALEQQLDKGSKP